MRAVDKRQDLGPPGTRDPLALAGPKALLAQAAPMERGAQLMALTGGLPTETRLHRDGRIASPTGRWCLAPQKRCRANREHFADRETAEKDLFGPGGAPA